MYNPALPPYVSHIEGNRLINAYVETYVCPTTTSDTILGGEPFRETLNAAGFGAPNGTASAPRLAPLADS